MIGWVWGAVGGLGIVGMIALAIFGGPFASVIAKLGEATLTPIAGVVGQGLSMFVKSAFDGGVDMVATGQRILFVALMCSGTYWYAERVAWKHAHANFHLTAKHFVEARPRGHR